MKSGVMHALSWHGYSVFGDPRSVAAVERAVKDQSRLDGTLEKLWSTEIALNAAREQIASLTEPS